MIFQKKNKPKFPNCIYYTLGEYVAQFKFTVLLMANRPLRITSGPVDLEAIQSSHSLQDPELKVSRDN